MVLFSSFVAFISKAFHAEVRILPESVFSLPPPVPAAALSQLTQNWGADLGPLQAAKDEEETEEVVASSALGVVYGSLIGCHFHTLKEEQRAALQSDAHQDAFMLLLGTSGNT